MHHKRLRPKNRRAGCLMCKPHKMNGLKGSVKALTPRYRKLWDAAQFQIEEFEREDFDAEALWYYEVNEKYDRIEDLNNRIIA